MYAISLRFQWNMLSSAWLVKTILIFLSTIKGSWEVLSLQPHGNTPWAGGPAAQSRTDGCLMYLFLRGLLCHVLLLVQELALWLQVWPTCAFLKAFGNTSQHRLFAPWEFLADSRIYGGNPLVAASLLCVGCQKGGWRAGTLSPDFSIA